MRYPTSMDMNNRCFYQLPKRQLLGGRNIIWLKFIAVCPCGKVGLVMITGKSVKEICTFKGM